MNEDLDSRNYQNLKNSIEFAQHTVYKKYLQNLNEYPIVSPSPIFLDESPDKCLRFFRLDEITYKNGEDMFQKLSTVYHASMSLGCNLVIMVDVDSVDSATKIYVGVRNSGDSSEGRAKLVTSYRALKNGLTSNFPGTKFHDIPTQVNMTNMIEDIFGDHVKHICTVSGVASIREKTKTEDKNFIQGLERFIDAMKGNAYTAIFLAEPISIDEQFAIRSGYENLYTDLSTFSKSIWSYNENESKAVMESLSEGLSSSIMNGVNHTQAHTQSKGVNIGISSTNSTSNAKSSTTSIGKTSPTLFSRVMSGTAILAPIILPYGTAVGAIAGLLSGSTKTKSVSESIAESISKSFGVNSGMNVSYSKTKSEGTSHSVTDTVSKTKTDGITDTIGTGKTLQIECINKPISEMLERIDEQLTRVKEGEDYGSYSCGAYFLSGKQESAILAASTYRALIIGEGSSVESGAINSWNGLETQDKVSIMKEYLKRFVHPIFALPTSEEEEGYQKIITYSAANTVSGLELPLHLGLPTKSVYGIPVLEHAEFGRNVSEKSAFSKKDQRKIRLGKIYNMGQIEQKIPVQLKVSALTAHTFITGSTGSGKSNTIYQILKKLNEEGIKFLVVEPTKGEYKDSEVFGNQSDVTVLGTNPTIRGIELLRINPFSFPEGIHVLEHIDRLVEIFNVCWPMYAAMPAILKDAILRSYETVGWNLEESINIGYPGLFPTFTDVYNKIKEVLNESDYSQDNKGDYIGSLVTRLRSLTNGLNGLIFHPNEITNEILFDTNVIVDISRVGASETKSLIMGLLVLKLQEYRIVKGKYNQDLKHVTVLEEAHNLLRRTSIEQSSESSNLLGKSVEMITNSIAEMRTYGEGFIIADQSPGLLDLSVIRNTNTKIIMRLPDYSDRELVGKAAGLNDAQINEISKLDNGVGVVMQSEWIEAVLCMIDKYVPAHSTEDIVNERVIINSNINQKNLEHEIIEHIMSKEIYRKGDRLDLLRYRDFVMKSKLDTDVKKSFIDYLESDNTVKESASRKFVYNFFHAEEAIIKATKHKDIRDWISEVRNHLTPSVKEYSNEKVEFLVILIIQELLQRDNSYQDIFLRVTEIHRDTGKIF
jgi:hypothetical protein